MKVLVTGLNGFTGAYLKQDLEQSGHTVVGLHANLKDWQAVADEIRKVQPQGVIHLAAVSYVPSGENADVYAVNTLGAQGLLEALAALPAAPEKVVLASSSNVYGWVEGKITEEHCPRPVSHYGCSKLAMEHIAATYIDRLPIVIARPFNYTGIGQSHKFLIPKIVQHFVEKRPVIELGNINVARDFSDVRWVSKAYCALLEQGKPDGCYNLCSGSAISIDAILQTLSEISGHRIDVEVNADFVRSNDIKSQSGDPTKILALLKTSSTPDFAETLQWMATAANQGHKSNKAQ
jgi:nucleoside-diphosphate-sugar epimerase